MAVDLLGREVAGFFEFMVNLLLNPMGSHAHEARLRVAGSDGFADLESPIPPVLTHLANGKFNPFAVHLESSIRPVIKLDRNGLSLFKTEQLLKLVDDLAADSGTEPPGRYSLSGGRLMPRYFFDIKDGHRLVDSAGRECKNDTAAKDMAAALAIVVSIDTPAVDPSRYISVLNDARQEIFQAAVYSKPVAA
jgi:hypothetical protein